MNKILIKSAVLILRAVHHELRQSIITLLKQGKELTVTDIYLNLKIEQPVASQHLAILRHAGIVLYRKSGKFIYYSVDKTRIKEIESLCKQLTEFK